jgi:hypothetical protein
MVHFSLYVGNKWLLPHSLTQIGYPYRYKKHLRVYCTHLRQFDCNCRLSPHNRGH